MYGRTDRRPTPSAGLMTGTSALCFPARMPSELMAAVIHSADERVPVDDLELGVTWLRHAAHTLLS